MYKTLLLLLMFVGQGFSSLAQKTFTPKTVYQSSKLVIKQIDNNSFQHISYLQTNDFGNVPCNGLIVKNNNEVAIFDTPTNDSSSTELIQWINKKLHCTIVAIIPTHFHNDCLGGLRSFHQNHIRSFAFNRTIQLAKDNKYEIPQNAFQDSLLLKIGKSFAIIKYFGEGHTIDNVVAYYPNDNILFGGCLLKELDATVGYLGDANIAEWANTVSKIKTTYPKLKTVVPGHGEIGNNSLLDYTITLFKVISIE
jgi:metallo-beta-lactamase class B